LAEEVNVSRPEIGTSTPFSKLIPGRLELAFLSVQGTAVGRRS